MNVIDEIKENVALSLLMHEAKNPGFPGLKGPGPRS